MNSMYHAGELRVQARAGVEAMARKVGNIIRAKIPVAAQAFLEQQRMAIAGSVSAKGQVWASLLTGEPGFLQPTDEDLLISGRYLTGDPLLENLAATGEIGLIAIEFATRRRMRLNGQAEILPGPALRITPRQVYSNCPKYIQAREISGPDREANPNNTVWQGPALTEKQQDWIAQADTFFIASYHLEGGADASHRGGRPGFVKVLDGNRLIFPDYSGNKMFMTLGNLEANPNSGLLFLNFETGSVVQLTGKAQIEWDGEIVEQFAGAERAITFQIEEVRELANALPREWHFLNYSPFNPVAS